MVKHIILWNLKETYSDSEKDEIRKNIKRELENLKGMLMVDKEADNKQHTKTTAPRYSEAWKHGRNVHSFMLLYT